MFKPSVMHAIDSLWINSSPERIFSEILQYERMSSRLFYYQCHIDPSHTPLRVGSRVRHYMGIGKLTFTQFTRTIRELVPSSLIVETYDEGDMTGQGIWRLTPHNQGTWLSYDCSVQSNSPYYHMVFKTPFAQYGHHLVYRQILAAIKRTCEA